MASSAGGGPTSGPSGEARFTDFFAKTGAVVQELAALGDKIALSEAPAPALQVSIVDDPDLDSRIVWSSGSLVRSNTGEYFALLPNSYDEVTDRYLIQGPDPPLSGWALAQAVSETAEKSPLGSGRVTPPRDHCSSCGVA